MSGTFTRAGFKQTGGTASSVAETAYSGPLAQSGTLDLSRGLAGDPLADSRALICTGVTVGELPAKGQVLMRPVVGGNATDGVAQCAPVQTPETARRFRSEATGPVTARSQRALIDPYAEERGLVRQVFSWAVAPDGRQYMPTAQNHWEPMSEPMRPAATLTVPMSGPVVLDVTRDRDLSGRVGTLVFIGIGENWGSVRSLNTAGHHHTVRRRRAAGV